MDELTLYGQKREINDKHYVTQIYQFYSKLEKEGRLAILKKGTWYGITIINNNKEYYFVGNTTYIPNLERITIPKSKFLIINGTSINQKDIVKTEIKMHNCYLPSTNYHYQNYSIIKMNAPLLYL